MILFSIVEAFEQGQRKEQDNSYANTGIRDVEDVEVKIDLRDAERDEVHDIAPIMRPIEQIADRTADNHAEDEFIDQRARIEDARVEIDDHANSRRNEHSQKDVIGKQAKGRPSILDVIDHQILPGQRDNRLAPWRTEVLYNQRFCPLIQRDDYNNGE